MDRRIVIGSLFLLVSSCSQQPQKRRLFQPELIIGTENGVEGGWFSSLSDYDVDADTTIYCVDNQDCKIKVFNARGKYWFDFGRKGQGPGEFMSPRSIAVSSEGSIFVLDVGQRNISRFTGTGQFLKSKTFAGNPAMIGMFDTGNLIVQIIKFDRDNLARSQLILCLLDRDLNEIKPSVYQGPMPNIHWVNVDPEHMVSFQTPYSAMVRWKIIGNRLYVGNSEDYKITVFNAAGDSVNEIKRYVKREKISISYRKKWIQETLKKYSERSQFVPSIMKESLEKITLPDHKPVFSGFGESPDGLIVFLNPVTEGTPSILYDISEREIDRMIFQYDDCKYYHGKYYRITGGDETPFTLTRYSTR
jgi:hypothetical protein